MADVEDTPRPEKDWMSVVSGFFSPQRDETTEKIPMPDTISSQAVMRKEGGQ